MNVQRNIQELGENGTRGTTTFDCH